MNPLRTPEAYRSTVDSLKVESNPRFKKRDVTGDGKPETFCNVFVEACCLALDAPLPRGLLAREQIGWLQTEGVAGNQWLSVTEEQARDMAAMGFPTVVGWIADVGHSHIAMVLPSAPHPPFPAETRIAQAGSTNFAEGSLSRGFGFRRKELLFFAHN